MSNRTAFNVTALLSPIEGSLHRDDRIAFGRIAPTRLSIDPVGDMEWLQLGNAERRELQDEGLTELAIAFASRLSPVLRAPIEKRINDDSDQIGCRCRRNDRLVHELVVAGKRLVLRSRPRPAIEPDSERSGYG